MLQILGGVPGDRQTTRQRISPSEPGTPMDLQAHLSDIRALIAGEGAAGRC